MKGKLIVAILMIIFVISIVKANPSGTGINIEDSETFDGETAISTPAVGGNVSEMTLTQTTQTQLWSAFYGNLSGETALKGSSGDTIFDWGAITYTKAYVFMTRLASVNWGTIIGASISHIENEDTALGMDGETEAINNTRTDASTWPDIDYGSAISVNYGIDMTSGSGWRSPILYDSTNAGLIFGVYVNSSGQAFNSQDADYQIMIPTGDVTRDYYVYAFME
ncbi:MAG TPA: hypothetical protein ENN46_03540 [Candidatus Woesearchaeota archaeon]|nr:hypothetical protein [Candidatus Woesearchaeota archaeon]